MPVTPDKNSLARVGVILLGSSPLELQCKQCKTTWQPGRLASGHLPSGWWRCPSDPRHTVDLDTYKEKPVTRTRVSGTRKLRYKDE